MHILLWLQQNGIGLLWVFLIFGFLIFIHEFGHFVVAKHVGVSVLEFALGFGQKIFGWKRGETEYAVRLFPLGGYVKMLGEGEEGDPNDPGNFQNKSLWRKVAIVAAGATMNYFLAIFLLFVVGVFYGINTYVPQIAAIKPNMPAAKAGLQVDDQILAINGQSFQSPYDPEKTVRSAVSRIRASADTPLHFQIKRQDNIFELTVTPEYNAKERAGLIGIIPVPGMVFKKTNLQGALANSLVSTAYFTKAPFKVIFQIIEGKRKINELTEGSAGPIGIGDIIVSTYSRYHKHGEALVHLLWLAAILNIFIGLFNLFPIPALDGSRIFFMLLGKAFGKPLNPKLEEGIHLVGFALLLLLLAMVTYQDILRIIHKAL